MTDLSGNRPLGDSKVSQFPNANAIAKAIEDAETYEPRQDNGTDPTNDGFPRTGFRRTRDGSIEREDQDKEGNSEWIWVCSPIRVTALTSNADGEAWGRLIEVKDPDGTVHEWAMPMALMAGDGSAYREELLQLGIRIAPGTKARYALHTLLGLWTPPQRARCVEKLGWHDDRVFVLPKSVLGSVGADPVVYQPNRVPVGTGVFRAGGTLDGWQNDVAALCAGNPVLIFAVSVAFSGPLLRPLGIEGGGYHLRGGSSLGKTTVQHAAGSVWGGGPDGFKLTWRATSNGLEAVAATHSDTFLVLDEMGQVDPREAGQVAYMLANGQGKVRANRYGYAREPQTWRVQFLSSGELSLTDKMAEDRGGRSKAGQLVRCLDIPATQRRYGAFDDLHGYDGGQAFANELRALSSQHFGHAGPAFVECLLENKEQAEEAARVLMGNIRERSSAGDGSTQVQRALDRFAVVGAAGELARIYGLVPWSEKEALDAAATVFRLWLDARGSIEDAETIEAIGAVRHFIEAHGSGRFERIGELVPRVGVAGELADQKIINRAGYVTREEDELRYFILPEVWKREVCAGHDALSVARALAVRGYLVRGDGKRLRRRLPRTDGGRIRAYCVSEAILADEPKHHGVAQ